MTICTKCEQDKGNDFRKNRKVCRECDNELARLRTLKNKEKQKPEFIICNVCNEKKTEFRINRGSCLDCERSNGRNYRRTTTKAKEWTENNKERMSELQHNWYETHKKEICEKRTERLKTDEKFKKGEDHRKMIRSCFKSYQDNDALNCNAKKLHNWIKFQFVEDMTTENYADVWTFDHVIPVDAFLKDKFSESIILNYLNICPVLKKKNLSKNKHFDYEQCMTHLENVVKFNKEDDDIKNYVIALKHYIQICETP